MPDNTEGDYTELRGHYRYDTDSKRYHRFEIITDAGVVGTVYIPKDLKPMPKKMILTYQSKEDD